MKTSLAIKKATVLHNKIENLMRPHDERLREILGDDSAHFCHQESDGWCIAYRGGSDNASVSFLDIDAVMELSGDEFLTAIDKAGI